MNKNYILLVVALLVVIAAGVYWVSSRTNRSSVFVPTASTTISHVESSAQKDTSSTIVNPPSPIRIDTGAANHVPLTITWQPGQKVGGFTVTKIIAYKDDPYGEGSGLFGGALIDFAGTATLQGTYMSDTLEVSSKNSSLLPQDTPLDHAICFTGDSNKSAIDELRSRGATEVSVTVSGYEIAIAPKGECHEFTKLLSVN